MCADIKRATAPAPLLDPLAQARRDREAIERFRQMQSGLPADLFRTRGASGSGRNAAPRRQPTAAERYRQRGTQLLQGGRLPAAFLALRRATELDPGDAQAHHMLGRAFLESGRLAEATASLKLATTLQDGLAAAHHDLAVALDRQGLNLEAMAAFREVVRPAPDLAKVVPERGMPTIRSGVSSSTAKPTWAAKSRADHLQSSAGRRGRGTGILDEARRRVGCFIGDLSHPRIRAICRETISRCCIGSAPRQPGWRTKVPFYLFQLGLIHLLFPKARIIHCRRHPIDTCLSMYFTDFRERFEFVTNKADLAFAYWQYVRLMAHWRAVLPSDRFLEGGLRDFDCRSRSCNPAADLLHRS
jgi:tetratricopeptide (TPR) repeat protein